MSDNCHFCNNGEGVLETHHIVPRRHGGTDAQENLVDLCPTCHRKLEALYDKRFYDALGVEKQTSQDRPGCEFCDEMADGQYQAGWRPANSSGFACRDCADEHGIGFSLEFPESTEASE